MTRNDSPLIEAIEGTIYTHALSATGGLTICGCGCECDHLNDARTDVLRQLARRIARLTPAARPTPDAPRSEPPAIHPDELDEMAHREGDGWTEERDKRKAPRVPPSGAPENNPTGVRLCSMCASRGALCTTHERMYRAGAKLDLVGIPHELPSGAPAPTAPPRWDTSVSHEEFLLRLAAHGEFSRQAADRLGHIASIVRAAALSPSETPPSETIERLRWLRDNTIAHHSYIRALDDAIARLAASPSGPAPTCDCGSPVGGMYAGVCDPCAVASLDDDAGVDVCGNCGYERRHHNADGSAHSLGSEEPCDFTLDRRASPSGPATAGMPTEEEKP